MPNLSLENANLNALLMVSLTINSRYLKAFITFQSRLSLRQTPFGSAVIGHLESFPSAREFNKMIEELSTVRTNLQDLGRGKGVGAEGNVEVCPILST